MSGIPQNPLCGYYKSEPLLQGARSPNDLAALQVYCDFAQSRQYGPIPQLAPQFQRVYQRPCACPFGYGYLDTAYQFSAGPKMINLNQALNYKSLQSQSPLNFYPGSTNMHARQ